MIVKKKETDTIKAYVAEKIKKMEIRRKNVKKKQRCFGNCFVHVISECLYFWRRVCDRYADEG